MPETTTLNDQNHVAGPDGTGCEVPAPKCPFPRSLCYVTGEYSIRLDYAGLTRLMEEVFALWDSLESSGVMDNKAGGMFEALLEHIGGLREWTGWDGVPGEFLR